jgi:energy-coupling factor transporter ATP-binding protein EcfA2
MRKYSFKFLEKKIILRLDSKICDNTEELISSDLFAQFLKKTIDELSAKDSPLLEIFSDSAHLSNDDIELLHKTLQYLTKLEGALIPNIVKGSDMFLRDPDLFSEFIEYMYDYWRSFDRFIVSASSTYEMNEKPYRTFNATIENLTHLVRQAYRDIKENITGSHPVVYRQVRAGAEAAAITLTPSPASFSKKYATIQDIPIIRQILLYPPLILNPPMNKRKGEFIKIDENPLDFIDFNEGQWLCYPAKVGELTINVYFHEKFFELGFSLSNLFELAKDGDLTHKPDGVYFFGVPGGVLDRFADFPTVFYDDTEQDMLVAAVPNRDEFGYFGYLKKMILTLHNIKIMKRGEMPFHGALVKIVLKSHQEATILLIGDSGAGKSETLEAFRILGDEFISEMRIIADDMGSVRINSQGEVMGYGTEIGAFVRLDDLQPGYAFGQLDRTIIMNPSQVNARAIVPVTPYSIIVKGHKIDMVLYANNYEMIDEDHPILERFETSEEALRTFREGTVMSKGTTTSTGLVHSYFANIFGPPQYKNLHEEIVQRYFQDFFKQGICVGQLRTRLGIQGYETKGPEEAARELLMLIKNSLLC